MQGHVRKPQSEGNGGGTCAQRSTLYGGTPGVQSSVWAKRREGRRQAAIATKPASRESGAGGPRASATHARVACVTRKPAVRSRRASARRRRGAASRSDVGQARSARSTDWRTGPQDGCRSAWGSRSSLTAQADRGRPSDRQRAGGGAPPRSAALALRAGKVVRSQHSVDRRPTGRSRRRIQRGRMSTLPARSAGRWF